MRAVQVPVLLRKTESRDELVAAMADLRAHLPLDRPLVICGRTHTRELAAALAGALPGNPRIAPAEGSTFGNVQALQAVAFGERATAIVAVGGGRVIDIAKYTAHGLHLPFAAVATQASNDGIASPVSVLLDERGRKQSLGATMPEAIIAPLDVIRTSSRESILAGIGDTLSNLSALLDWKASHEATGEPYDDFSALMAEQAAFAVSTMLLGRTPILSREFLTVLIDSLMLSGVAMAIAGSSRPCSGSEHLISHAMDELGVGHSHHGIQVGSAALFTLSLYQQSDLDLAAALHSAGMEVRVAPPGSSARGILSDVFSLAQRVRPGRTSVLDRFTPADLVARYGEFEETLVQEISNRQAAQLATVPPFPA